ncbi:DUF1153 domain-containing protein [Phenylobacterium sp.]|uniref:CtrA inhibitor SciP n=1 Tax=Phenylobacterium sp. TaxID=1871053 RepID=UPI003946D03D
MPDPRTNRAGQAYVIGPMGAALTLADLPPPDTVRWTPRRKAEVVAAVEGALISEAEALDRYALTAEEFASWRGAVQHHGMAGLRATRIQDYREGRAHG